MRVDAAPFKDKRVRQAFRLIANRKQMVAQALGGPRTVGNDVYSPFDACYAGDELPQREQDLDQAKSLLKRGRARRADDRPQHDTGRHGMVECAQVFAQNAKGAGVTVNVKNLDGGTFYGDQYLKWTFATDFWGTRNYLAQVAALAASSSPFNETHWDNTPKFNNALRRRRSTADGREAAVRDHRRDAADGVRRGRQHRVGLQTTSSMPTATRSRA